MQLLPTSGARSSSLWEGPTVEQVETFVNELLAEWCAPHTSLSSPAPYTHTRIYIAYLPRAPIARYAHG